jgi:hypothetical protein
MSLGPVTATAGGCLAPSASTGAAGSSSPSTGPEKLWLMVRGVLLFLAVAFLLGTVAASWVGDRIPL